MNSHCKSNNHTIQAICLIASANVRTAPLHSRHVSREKYFV